MAVATTAIKTKMANEICNDKSEDGSGTAGPEIISNKSKIYMFIPNFFSSNKYTIKVNVTFMLHLSIKNK